MRYMLDTDTRSYLIRGKSENLDRKVAGVRSNSLCMSVVTNAELLFGVERKGHLPKLDVGRRVRARLCACSCQTRVRRQADWKFGSANRRACAGCRCNARYQQRASLQEHSWIEVGQLVVTLWQLAFACPQSNRPRGVCPVDWDACCRGGLFQH